MADDVGDPIDFLGEYGEFLANAILRQFPFENAQVTLDDAQRVAGFMHDLAGLAGELLGQLGFDLLPVLVRFNDRIEADRGDLAEIGQPGNLALQAGVLLFGQAADNHADDAMARQHRDAEQAIGR